MAIILVTGGNRGIGYAIVTSISTRHPDSTILLGCRNEASGKEAIQQLEADGITGKVEAIQIDIESDSSITTAANAIVQNYGKLDGRTFFDKQTSLNKLLIFPIIQYLLITRLI